MVMSMPTSSPLSSSKCHGALVLPVPTMSLPRSKTVRSWLAGAALCIGLFGLKWHACEHGGTRQGCSHRTEFQKITALDILVHRFPLLASPILIPEPDAGAIQEFRLSNILDINPLCCTCYHMNRD